MRQLQPKILGLRTHAQTCEPFLRIAYLSIYLFIYLSNIYSDFSEQWNKYAKVEKSERKN